MSDKKPIIGVTADSYTADHQAYQLVGDKYLHAITDVVGGIPFVLPVVSELAQYPELIDKLDGILLTGSDSNVYPHYYNDTKHYKNMLLARTFHKLPARPDLCPSAPACVDLAAEAGR